jgi:hypothetical protein
MYTEIVHTNVKKKIMDVNETQCSKRLRYVFQGGTVSVYMKNMYCFSGRDQSWNDDIGRVPREVS